MRRYAICAALGFAVIAAATWTAAEEAKLDPGQPGFARGVMSRLDDLFRGEASHGEMAMTVVTKNYTRKMRIESWSLGKERTLVRILEPKKERGTATLKAGDDMFIYLSKTGRTVKITSGMMGSSWMGSHFTNDDLVRHTRFAEDYRIEFNPKKDADDATYRFTLVPKPEAPVVWGKLEITVRRSDLQPLRQVYFDEDGKPVRALEFSEYKKTSGRVLPHVLVMRPLDGSGEKTEVRWKNLEFGVKLRPSLFSLQNLRSM